MTAEIRERSLIPLVDLAAQHRPLSEEILRLTREILERGAFVGGPVVEEFEREWAHYCGTREAVAVASGTDALRFALMATGVQPGDEVVTVSFTFAATLEAILQAGARPVLVDVDPQTRNMDPRRLEAALTPRTRAILPVHMYGHPADMAAIGSFAAERGLIVVEDASQAHGATFEGRRAGSMGHAASFSFYPAKNLGACGEAGAVTTNDPGIARRVRMLRDHGQDRKNDHEFPGYNGKLDALQAAVLSLKLPRLEEWNERRRSLASLYSELLRGVADLGLPEEDERATHVYHLYVVRSAGREELRKRLLERGVATGVHYPVPLHLQKAFASLGHGAGAFPESEALAREVLSLPMYPELDPDSVRFVASEIRRVFAA